MSTFAERAAVARIKSETLLDAEVFDVMASVVVDLACSWADAAFLIIDTGREIAQSDAEPDFIKWAHAVAADYVFDLIDDRERTAAGMDATPEQRRALICESVALHQWRLEHLMVHAAQRGRA